MPMSYLPWQRPAAFNERPCVRDARVTLTYDEFGSRVEAAAEQFAALGVGRGSVVATMLPNRVELLITVMAAWRLGAAATPINPTFTATEAEYQVADSGAGLVVTADTGLALGDARLLDVEQLAGAPKNSLPAAVTDPADLALLVYTSGSTGKPKGVMLDHANLDAMVASMGAAITISAADHCLLVLPLFHVNAICVSFLTPLSVGAQLSVLERFHPVEFLSAVETLRPTYFSAVPTIYSHLVALPAEVTPDVGSLRFAICGAAPAPPDLLAAVEARFGFGMIEGYGLSEGTCASTCNPVNGVRKPGTVGVALPGQQVAVVGADGAPVPNGERGEVMIRGANVMRGYLNRPEATAEALAHGWLRTGDVGVLDDDGYLRIVDRIKDLIIRGGENLYPKEIENVLHSAPGVLEAAVIGGPDPIYGEVPIAFVAAVPGAAIDSDAVLAHSRAHLTKVKLPVEIHVLDALPKNPVGKIDKPTLRRQLSAVGAKEA